ncbi:MAG: hypothetical protein DRI23_03875 [Candidatus Cloacimonadota bacterium]|nr:MAG: hypothetical protein DRI23_03875 [Candidatus Cloacimonadota bacterium]
MVEADRIHWKLCTDNRCNLFQDVCDRKINPRFDLSVIVNCKIKKILKVDYPRGRAKGYLVNFI